MALVEYSSSEDSSKEVSNLKNGEQGKSLKRKREAPIPNENLPPLPSSFHDLYASSSRPSTQDDPQLHGGRQRVTPHVEGNWPSHVYIEWRPSRTESQKLPNILSSVHSPSLQTNSLLRSDLGAPLPLHISLSRSISLLTHQRDSFLSSLQNSINASAIRPFTLSLKPPKWVPNYERTRWFLVLSIARPSCNSLNSILRIANATAEAFGQPTLYASPTQPAQNLLSQSKDPIRGGRNHRYDSRGQGHGVRSTIPFNKRAPPATPAPPPPDCSDHFHVSLAWSLEPPSPRDEEMIEEIAFEKLLEDVKIETEAVKVKIGNAVHVVPLRRTGVEEGGRGILGV